MSLLDRRLTMSRPPLGLALSHDSIGQAEVTVHAWRQFRARAHQLRQWQARSRVVSAISLSFKQGLAVRPSPYEAVMARRQRRARTVWFICDNRFRVKHVVALSRKGQQKIVTVVPF
ncbi:MAG: hypothetical protein A3B30_00010 [Candidatus Komeilibacteria bacterium RIFCSPLOWO2_01_FULL_52_15]|uniref:Uncharacterized protein n=2 Tax=Candidatus Komeiliibacteriota TaxID=1817908 RepID=A0A1G2BPV1_9BACT|nr:MAG: hypothetical protein A3B30_00010 [Candidatus Komeilibacteria bacterium RIFCSPLOWO2_01_FULL_52_15]